LKEFIGLDDKGLSQYRDVDGDGIVTDNDRIAAGTALPNKQYNFFGRVSYKGFDLVLISMAYLETKFMITQLTQTSINYVFQKESTLLLKY
jgi:hypothetical protein